MANGWHRLLRRAQRYQELPLAALQAIAELRPKLAELEHSRAMNRSSAAAGLAFRVACCHRRSQKDLTGLARCRADRWVLGGAKSSGCRVSRLW